VIKGRSIREYLEYGSLQANKQLSPEFGCRLALHSGHSGPQLDIHSRWHLHCGFLPTAAAIHSFNSFLPNLNAFQPNIITGDGEFTTNIVAGSHLQARLPAPTSLRRAASKGTMMRSPIRRVSWSSANQEAADCVGVNDSGRGAN
jgi:hypothetical protein